MPGCGALCPGTGGTRCTSPAAGKTQDPDLTCENKDEFKDDVRPCRCLTSRTHKAGSSQVGAEREHAFGHSCTAQQTGMRERGQFTCPLGALAPAARNRESATSAPKA